MTIKTLSMVIAPPAWGKTTRILGLTGSFRSIWFVSPLRALADEVSLRFKRDSNSVYGSVSEFKKIDAKQKSVLVMTPEMVDSSWVNPMIIGPQDLLVIDEVHLYFHWAHFRPGLWHALSELLSRFDLVLAMSATVSFTMFNEFRTILKSEFDHLHLVNAGNYVLKNPPAHVYKISNQLALILELKWRLLKSKRESFQNRCYLVFCQYRQEVKSWEKILTDWGYRCASCIGGESRFFKIDPTNPPEVIISTTVLSHGVNLPMVWAVFFLYMEQNDDFLLQMVARGGRRGEDFDLYLPHPDSSIWHRFKDKLKSIGREVRMLTC